MTGGIFISYRRDDAKHAAGRLVDRLVAGVGRDKLFMDVDNVEPGLDFVKVLNDQVAKCDVLLALIGPQWLEARDKDGNRRLDSPGDFVRIEIEAALARDIRVVPVLLDGAELPSSEALPSTLQPLVRRQAVRISHERFAPEADGLAAAMRRALGTPETQAPIAAVQTAPAQPTPVSPEPPRPQALSMAAKARAIKDIVSPPAPNTSGTSENTTQAASSEQRHPKFIAACLFAIAAPFAAFFCGVLFQTAAQSFGLYLEFRYSVFLGSLIFALVVGFFARRFVRQNAESLAGWHVSLFWASTAAVFGVVLTHAVVVFNLLGITGGLVPYELEPFVPGIAVALLGGLRVRHWWRRNHSLRANRFEYFVSWFLLATVTTIGFGALFSAVGLNFIGSGNGAIVSGWLFGGLASILAGLWQRKRWSS